MTTCAEITATNAASAKLRAASHEKGALFPYFGYVDVDMFECPPFVMFTNNDSPVVANIVNKGTFEPQSMKLWCRLAPTATGILDIGANVGIYSLCAAGIRPDLTINAFEPNPYAFARLRVNKEVNRLSNIREFRMALGHEQVLTKMTWVVKPGGNISSGGGVGDRIGDTEAFFANVIALDQTVIHKKLGNRPLIKIDVEGGELFALLGMSRVLSLKPDIILETFLERECKAINNMFQSAGYSFYRIHERDLRLEKVPNLVPSVIDDNHIFNQLMTVRSEAEIAALMA